MNRKYLKKGTENANDSYVYIGRPSIFGNPFVIGKHGTREEVIEQYEKWIMGNKDLLKKVKTLKGKKLVCWCKPLACHGDILAKLADEKTEETALQYL